MDYAGENIDIVAEKSVIATLLGDEGYDLWMDVNDIINENSFDFDNHKVIYASVNAIRQTSPDVKGINLPLLISTSKTLGYKDFLDSKAEKTYLKDLLKSSVTERVNAKALAIKLRKLEIARIIRYQLKMVDERLKNITGAEKGSEILAMAEQPILDLSQALHGFEGQNTKPLFEDVESWVEERLSNPNRFVGISTGWEPLDKVIGGGMRLGTVGVIASRFGFGKSSAGENIALNVAQLGYPVLILDTEMSVDERLPRDLAMVSGVYISEIEHGTAGNDPQKAQKVREAAQKLKGLSHLYDYRNVCGMDFDQIVAIMKTWVFNKVGLDENGVAKPCLVILDYLKLQNDAGISKNVAEYMLLGLLTTAFVNFCQKYKVAGLTFAQVNRQGLQSEESDSIAGSDRILWFSSWCAFMKPQSDEELDKQKAFGLKQLFDRKLIILKSRHGPGLEHGNYIHLRFNRFICKMICGPSNFELEKFVTKEKETIFDENADNPVF